MSNKNERKGRQRDGDDSEDDKDELERETVEEYVRFRGMRVMRRKPV